MNPQQVGRAGELFAAAEIHRRGGYAATFAGDMPGIDILASDLADSRQTSGTWHARFPRDAEDGPVDPLKTSFWIFVDLGTENPELLHRRAVMDAQRHLAAARGLSQGSRGSGRV
jgi:hypothetical protein